MNNNKMSGQIAGCIEDCLDCYKSCAQTLSYCLQKGGEHSNNEHIKLLIDCIKICHISANFMLRNSQFSEKICQLCAEICRRCALDCETFVGDDTMQTCADICKQCALSCEQMAQ